MQTEKNLSFKVKNIHSVQEALKVLAPFLV